MWSHRQHPQQNIPLETKLSGAERPQHLCGCCSGPVCSGSQWMPDREPRYLQSLLSLSSIFMVFVHCTCKYPSCVLQTCSKTMCTRRTLSHLCFICYSNKLNCWLFVVFRWANFVLIYLILLGWTAMLRTAVVNQTYSVCLVGGSRFMMQWVWINE